MPAKTWHEDGEGLSLTLQNAKNLLKKFRLMHFTHFGAWIKMPPMKLAKV